MAKITFITLYDQHSAGIRIMSRMLRQAGHTCHIIYFKLAYKGLLEQPAVDPIASEVFENWELRTYARSDEIWTEREIELLLEHLAMTDSDIIGIGNRSPLDEPCFDLLQQIRHAFADKIMIAGGFGPFLRPEHYLNHVDFVVFGEAEETVLELADAYDNQLPMKDIKNLIYMQDGCLARNSVRKVSLSLDIYPLPDYENPGICYIEGDHIHDRDPVSQFDPGTDTYPVLIGRGCIKKCSYCSAGQWQQHYRDYGNQTIRSHRVRSSDHIISELKAAKGRGYQYISILESHLVGTRDFLLDFFDLYKKEVGLPFTSVLHYAQIADHPDILDAACEAGLSKSPIGIQHGSERFARDMFHRDIPNDLILHVANMFREKGLKQEYQFIAGIPFETEEALDESFALVRKLPMENAGLVVTRLAVYPDSPLERLMREKQMPRYCDPNRWVLTALLYNLCAALDDRSFNTVRAMTRAFIDAHGKEAIDLLPPYKRALAVTLEKENIAFPDHPAFRHWIETKSSSPC